MVELLVVIAIIGILIALLLPAVQAAREAARRAQCTNNLRQLALAMLNYESAHKTFPFAYMVDLPPAKTANAQAWGTRVLPFIEQQAIYDTYDSRVPAVNQANSFGHSATVAAKNIQLIQTPLTIFVCPSGPGDAAERIYDGEAPLGSLTLTWRAAPSDYTPITGVRGTYANLAYTNWTETGSRNGAIQPRAGSMGDKSSRIVDISDGLSNTIMFAERIGGGKIIRKNRQIGNPTTDDLLGRSNGGGWGDFLNGEHWPQGSLADGASASNGGPCAINCNNVRSEGFYAAHPGGMQAAMCDGSVTFVSETVGAFVFAAAITRAGGETASLP